MNQVKGFTSAYATYYKKRYKCSLSFNDGCYTVILPKELRDKKPKRKIRVELKID